MSRLRLVGAVLRGVSYWVRMRSQGLLATVEASPDNAGGGVPPLRRWGALRTEPPPRVPGMRLVQYQLLALSGCGRLARSVCLVVATFMYGSHLGNNERTILCATNKSDFSRLQR